MTPASLLFPGPPESSVCTCVCGLPPSLFWWNLRMSGRLHVRTGPVRSGCFRTSLKKNSVTLKCLTSVDVDLKLSLCGTAVLCSPPCWSPPDAACLHRAVLRSSPPPTSWSRPGWSDPSRCAPGTSPSLSRVRRTTSVCSTSRAKSSASPPCASTPPASSVRTPR